MKKFQFSEVNHHSKNDSIFVVDKDIAWLNEDKNNRITNTNTEAQRTKQIFLAIHKKRSKSTKQECSE